MKFYVMKILREEKCFFGFTLDYLLVSYNFWKLKWKKKKNRLLVELVGKLTFSGMG